MISLYILLASLLNPIKESDLNVIVQKAVETGSDSFLIIQNNQVLVDLVPDSGPLELQSVTKSITSLAIGILIDQKKIASIDEPVWRWYPEWKNSPKETITLRHLLTHTSGLEAQDSGEEIYRTSDSVQLALDAPVVHPPGTHFFYNNKAINLLSGIVEKASGMREDLFMKEHLFEPLAIKDFSWSIDGAGHAYGHADIQMKAKDLAKIGQLILQNGKWDGKQLISKQWLAQSIEPSPLNHECGLLWWVWDTPRAGFAAKGYLGQYLIVIPESKLIVVRQTNHDIDEFESLPELAAKLCS